MNRLTKKNENILTNDIEKYIINPYENLKVINKLGQIEDLEEELGIDLITLFKVLRDGVYIKYHREIKELKNKAGITYLFSLTLTGINWEDTYYNTGFLPYKDYGITWALTKEELEK